MMTEHSQYYIAGFIKRAADYGIPESSAKKLLKLAYDREDDPEDYKITQSNPIGRYLSLKAHRNQAIIDHPYATAWGHIKGTLGGTALGGLGGAGLGALAAMLTGDATPERLKALSLLGAMLGSTTGGVLGGIKGRADASLGKSEEKIRQRLKETAEGLQSRSILGNALRGAKNLGLLGGLAGAGIGALTGAIPLITGEDIPKEQLLESIKDTAITGGLGGLTSGVLGGGILGLVNSAIHKNTTPETRARARKMLGKHPYATQLPGGDIIGALES